MWNNDGGIHEIPIEGVPGRMWLCGKHHIGPDVHGVRRRTNDSTVVCLTERHELAGRYDEYVAWLDAHDHGSAVWFPIPDLGAPPVGSAHALFSSLGSRLQAGGNLVVHCAGGIGRAGTTAVGTLMMLGRSMPEALQHVRRHRPMAGPEAGPQHALIAELSTMLTTGKGAS
jgi:protein-tyrosine phosphatase